MTVEELIKELSKMPEDLKVNVRIRKLYGYQEVRASEVRKDYDCVIIQANAD